jgi:hypothetical protein
MSFGSVQSLIFYIFLFFWSDGPKKERKKVWPNKDAFHQEKKTKRKTEL